MVSTAMMGRNGTGAAPVPCKDTKTPEYSKHPPRSYLTGAKRGNPVVVWTAVQ
jgi:hypothetical protein